MPLTVLNRARRNAAIQEKFYGESNITRTEEGSIGRALQDSIRSELRAVEDRIDTAGADANPITSSGPHLELWSEFFDQERDLTVRAEVQEADRVVRLTPGPGASTFGDLNGGLAMTVTASEFRAFGRSQLFTDRGVEEFDIEYELFEDLTLNPADTEQYISIIATQPGSEFNIGANQLKDHNFINYTTYPDIKLTIENLSPITNGDDDEDDDRFRYRLSRLGFLRPVDFPEQISNEINRIPGINDVITIQNFSGSGTIDYFIDTQSFQVPDNILDQAREAVQRANNHGANINVDKIQRLGIAIELTVKFKPGTTEEDKNIILNNIELQITNEIVTTNIGESLDLEDLYRRIGLAYNNVASIGNTGKGFDSVILYREGLFEQRVGEALANTLSIIQLSQIERLLPENSILRPFKVTESIR